MCTKRMKEQWKYTPESAFCHAAIETSDGRVVAMEHQFHADMFQRTVAEHNALAAVADPAALRAALEELREHVVYVGELMANMSWPDRKEHCYYHFCNLVEMIGKLLPEETPCTKD